MEEQKFNDAKDKAIEKTKEVFTESKRIILENPKTFVAQIAIFTVLYYLITALITRLLVDVLDFGSFTFSLVEILCVVTFTAFLIRWRTNRLTRRLNMDSDNTPSVFPLTLTVCGMVAFCLFLFFVTKSGNYSVMKGMSYFATVVFGMEIHAGAMELAMWVILLHALSAIAGYQVYKRVLPKVLAKKEMKQE